MIRRALIASMSTVLLGLGSLLTGPELGAQRLRDARAGISMPGFSIPSLPIVPHTRPELPREDTGKSPFLAGMLSLYIPGAGSFYAGNYRHGLVHFLVSNGSLGLAIVDLGKCVHTFAPPQRVTCTGGNDVGVITGWIVFFGNDIWSIFTAVSDAKRTRTQKPAPVGGDAANANEGRSDPVPAVP